MPKKNYLFDSNALLAFFQNEKGAETVCKLLEENERFHKFINIMNLGEILYTTLKRFGREKKIEIFSNLIGMNFDILPVDNSIILEAADLKGERALSFIDCIATIIAMKKKMIVVTGDKEFREVEDLVEVCWIY